MKFYQLHVDSKIERHFVQPVVSDMSIFFQEFDGKFFDSEWISPNLRIITTDDNGNEMQPTDNYYFAAHILALSDKCVSALYDHLNKNGQFLPVKKIENIKLYNCTRLLDCIDEELSDIVRFSTGKIMTFKKLVLKKSICEQYSIFRLQKHPLGYLYVSDEIRSIVNDAGILGFEFKEVETV